MTDPTHTALILGIGFLLVVCIAWSSSARYSVPDPDDEPTHPEPPE